MSENIDAAWIQRFSIPAMDLKRPSTEDGERRIAVTVAIAVEESALLAVVDRIAMRRAITCCVR